jgi:oxygen-independent coproporphyrinogen-3 oxidase
MAGVYIHIPFCHKACTYCDFHFSVSLKNKAALVEALLKEIELRKSFLDEPVSTIYFGGGTPSVLNADEINRITEKVAEHFQLALTEVTLEANPEDLTPAYLQSLRKTVVNRLSIGIQSFSNERLQWMNRSHTAEQACNAVQRTKDEGFDISIDLIFALPGMTIHEWEEQLLKASSLQVSHISAYSLTLESKTAYAHQVKNKKVQELNDSDAEAQFLAAHDFFSAKGYHHYEISNYAISGKEAKHNSSYWLQAPYLGLGPSAHSFKKQLRCWNVANNNSYIKSVEQGILPLTCEELQTKDTFNETVMTALRTAVGLNIKTLEKKTPHEMFQQFLKDVSLQKQKGWIEQKGDVVFIPLVHWYKADSVISEFFITH